MLLGKALIIRGKPRSIALTIAISLNSALLPYSALAGIAANLHPSPIALPQLPQAGNELPANTAIVGRVLLDIVLDPGRKYDLPVTMITALPVYDSSGSPVIPEGSLITALIKKQDGGDYIVIDKIVYRGLNISMPSEGRLIPAQVKPENYGNFIVPPKTKASSVASALDQSAFVSTILAIAIASTYRNTSDGNQTQSVTPLVLGILGVDMGVKLIAALFDKAPRQLPPLVEIPRDSLIVFTLQNALVLPQSNAPETVVPKTAQ